ncbi:MAG: hypothetical protein WC794_00825 [Candidatus Doudnabacteria bacterium]|jgi:hypothetical protein
MYSESEPASPIMIENLYGNLDELFKTCSILPREFSDGRKNLSEIDKNKLAYEGSEAIWTQIKSVLEQLRNLDPDHFKSKALEFVEKNDDYIFSGLKEDILDYIKLHS